MSKECDVRRETRETSERQSRGAQQTRIVLIYCTVVRAGRQLCTRPDVAAAAARTRIAPSTVRLRLPDGYGYGYGLQYFTQQLLYSVYEQSNCSAQQKMKRRGLTYTYTNEYNQIIKQAAILQSWRIPLPAAAAAAALLCSSQLLFVSMFNVTSLVPELIRRTEENMSPNAILSNKFSSHL